MGQLCTIITIILIWIISFVEPSGWANVIHLTDKVNNLVLITAIAFFILSPSTRQNISRVLFLFIILSFCVIPLITQNSWQGAEYLISFLTVYIVSQGKITHKVIYYSALAIAALGLGLLYIYSRGSLLSGWNDNSISMTGLFSFLYFSIFLISKKGTNQFWVWNIISLFYIVLLFSTDCRSGMLFAIISIIGIFYSNKVNHFLKKNWITLLVLNTPLIIAYIVIAISQSEYFRELDAWSLQEFNKYIFNGRDILWDYAFKFLESSGYLGTGKFLMNYHNSGVAAISVFGILGYISWIIYFNTNIKQLKSYLNDDIVFASLLSFILIFLQQSVDLGFIGPTPNLIPYMILGVGLGRIRTLVK